MNRTNHYITDVMKNVFASPERREQFEGDLRTHIAERMENGESEVEVLKKMGEPHDVAGEFMAEANIRFAGFWERLLAFILDIHICLGIGGIMFLLFYMIPHTLLKTVIETPIVMIPNDPYGSFPATVLQIVLVAFLGLSIIGAILFYFPAMEALFGWTVGKWLLRLRVLRDSIQKINLGHAILRRLSLYFEFLAIDAMFIPFTQKKQRAFDLIAKTVVIRETYVKWSWIRTVVIIFILVVLPVIVLWLLHSQLLTIRMLPTPLHIHKPIIL